MNKISELFKKAIVKIIKNKIMKYLYTGIPATGIDYQENNEAGYKNLSEKKKRLDEGGCFEWPNMIALNNAIASFIGDAKKIVNIGSGTGTFEWFASVDESIVFVASDFDVECIDWCKKNRSKKNIVYCSKTQEELLDEYGDFDLAVSVDTIEHVGDYGEFLKKFSKMANRAIITTPNKDRSYESATSSKPEYWQHVREFDAGEFYWVLKIFYKKVTLYSMPNVNIPQVQKIGLMSTMSPLIAVCENAKK